MSDRFFIRPASVEDLPSLGGIQEESSKLFPPERIPDSAPLPTPDDFRPSLEERLLFVATSEEALVGFSQSEMSRNSLYLSQVSVLPEFGRRGIGRSLVERVISTGRERRLSAVTLTTFRDLPWNAPFYASMGFREIPPHQISGELLAHIEREQRAGLTNRVAMQCNITA